MADDYYQVLGVPRTATEEDIRKAYREMARKYHPDLHPDDDAAKEQFKKVQTAFDTLNDPSKREMYDRYGSSFEGVGGGAGGWSPQGQAGPFPGGFQGGGEVDLESMRARCPGKSPSLYSPYECGRRGRPASICSRKGDHGYGGNVPPISFLHH